MFNLKQVSISVAAIAATLTINIFDSNTAQAAIISGQIRGTWEYVGMGTSGFRIGDPFTVDYTYDNDRITIEDRSDIFEQYAEAFQALNPTKVLPFFHFPAMLISLEKAVVIGNPIIGYFGFNQVMNDLKRRCFTIAVAMSFMAKASQNTYPALVS